MYNINIAQEFIKEIKEKKLKTLIITRVLQD